MNEASDAVIRKLATERRASLTNLVEQIKKDSAMPEEIASEGAKRKHYYEGKHKLYFEAFLRSLYPRGMDKGEIHPVALNYVKTFAVTTADVYRSGGVKRKASEGQEALDRVVKEAQLQRWMPDTERKSKAGSGMFLRCVPGAKTHKAQVRQFWPHEVWVIPDPAEPRSLQHALALMVQTSLGEYEIWTRSATGELFAEVIDVRQEGSPVTRPLYGDGRWPTDVLPWVVFHDGVADGPYLVTDCDLIDAANDMNAYWTEQFNLLRWQAHTPLVGNNIGDSDVNGGPGGLTNLPPDGTLTAVNVSPQILPALETIKQFTKAQAVVRRQPSTAFSTDPSHATSGVARMIENETSDEARAERILDAQVFEEQHLLPVLCEMDRIFNPAADNVPETAEFSFIPAPPKNFADPNQTLMNLLAVHDKGGVSLAEVLVQGGLAATKEEALDKIKEARAESDVRPPAVPAEGPGPDSSPEIPTGDQAEGS